MTKIIQFPDNFVWGAATSAYQIEGSPLADGAGASIWQRFVNTPGTIRDGDTGDVACDHYRRYVGDVALMKQIGLQAYRFSISWSRVLPQGRGAVNQKGLDFYDKLVDELLANGIKPMVTLFHWDLPVALDDQGGWLNRDIADWFADYSRIMFRKLDDRVASWATLNEPWVVSDQGYLHGALAPGHRNKYEAPIAAHNLLRAHGAAVKAYREEGKHQIGLVVNLEPKYPASDSEEDRSANMRADSMFLATAVSVISNTMFSGGAPPSLDAADQAAAARGHAYMNGQFLDPVFRGHYPAGMKDVFGDAWPDWPAEDLALISQPIDFLGINYYTRSVSRDDAQSYPLRATP